MPHKIDEAEEWRPIAGCEGPYSISSLGRVRSERLASAEHDGIMACSEQSKGYLCVGIRRLGGKCNNVTRLVHHLVAEVFLGPRPEGLQVNHIDGNKRNNSVSNLEYVTPLRNRRHAIETGLHSPPPLHFGDRHHKAKLSERKVREIRALAKAIPLARIARVYGVADVTVSRAVSKKNWSHVV